MGCGEDPGGKLATFSISLATAGAQESGITVNTNYGGCNFCTFVGTNAIFIAPATISAKEVLGIFLGNSANNYIPTAGSNPLYYRAAKPPENDFIHPSINPSYSDLYLTFNDTATNKSVLQKWNVLVESIPPVSVNINDFSYSISYTGSSYVYVAQKTQATLPQEFYIYLTSSLNYMASLTDPALVYTIDAPPVAIAEVFDYCAIVFYNAAAITAVRFKMRDARSCLVNTHDFLGRGCKPILTSNCFPLCKTCFKENDPNSCIESNPYLFPGSSRLFSSLQ